MYKYHELLKRESQAMYKINHRVPENFFCLSSGTIIKVSSFKALIAKGNKFHLFLEGINSEIEITLAEGKWIEKLLIKELTNNQLEEQKDERNQTYKAK